MPLALNVIQKKFCVLQKKVLSFGPNRTVEVRPNSSAEPNVRWITNRKFDVNYQKYIKSIALRRGVLKIKYTLNVWLRNQVKVVGNCSNEKKYYLELLWHTCFWQIPMKGFFLKHATVMKKFEHKNSKKKKNHKRKNQQKRA